MEQYPTVQHILAGGQFHSRLASTALPGGKALVRWLSLIYSYNYWGAGCRISWHQLLRQSREERFGTTHPGVLFLNKHQASKK